MTILLVIANCALWKFQTPTTGPAGGDTPAPEPIRCHADISGVDNGPCRYGDTQARRKVVLFGDSHAQQWQRALSAMGVREHFQLITLAKWGCPAADVAVRRQESTSEFTECAIWRRNTIARIQQVEKPDVVILANLHLYVPADRPQEDVNWWINGLESTFHSVSAPGRTVVLIQDTPRPQTHMPDCLQVHAADPAFCDIPRERGYLTGYLEAETAWAERLGLPHIDPRGWLCDAQRCPSIIDGIPVYRDHSHVADAFIDHLAPKLESQLRPWILEPKLPGSPQ